MCVFPGLSFPRWIHDIFALALVPNLLIEKKGPIRMAWQRGLDYWRLSLIGLFVGQYSLWAIWSYFESSETVTAYILLFIFPLCWLVMPIVTLRDSRQNRLLSDGTSYHPLWICLNGVLVINLITVPLYLRKSRRIALNSDPDERIVSLLDDAEEHLQTGMSHLEDDDVEAAEAAFDKGAQNLEAAGKVKQEYETGPAVAEKVATTRSTFDDVMDQYHDHMVQLVRDQVAYASDKATAGEMALQQDAYEDALSRFQSAHEEIHRHFSPPVGDGLTDDNESEPGETVSIPAELGERIDDVHQDIQSGMTAALRGFIETHCPSPFYHTNTQLVEQAVRPCLTSIDVTAEAVLTDGTTVSFDHDPDMESALRDIELVCEELQGYADVRSVLIGWKAEGTARFLETLDSQFPPIDASREAPPVEPLARFRRTAETFLETALLLSQLVGEQPDGDRSDVDDAAIILWNALENIDTSSTEVFRTRVAELHETASIVREVEVYRRQFPTVPIGQLLSEMVTSLRSTSTVRPETIDSEYDRVSRLIEDETDGLEGEIEAFFDEWGSHPAIDRRVGENAIERAKQEDSQQPLIELLDQIDGDQNTLWTHDSLFSYSPSEFEHLVGTLFETYDYEVTVTAGSKDMGVDIWAESATERVAIQVKQFSKGNTVGRQTIQQLLSTVAQGDADRIVVVTSSSFARSARKYARDSAVEITLIDGDELLVQLSEQQVPIPSG